MGIAIACWAIYLVILQKINQEAGKFLEDKDEDQKPDFDGNQAYLSSLMDQGAKVLAISRAGEAVVLIVLAA